MPSSRPSRSSASPSAAFSPAPCSRKRSSAGQAWVGIRPRPQLAWTFRPCSGSRCSPRSSTRLLISSLTSCTTGSIRGSSVVRRPGILREPLNVVATVLIVAFALCALLAPVLAPYDPLAQTLSARLEPPSAAHWLGTDSLGRDIASRILYGARISLIIGVVVVGLAGIFGTFIGLVAGYAGGLADEALMRLTEVFLAFPPLILAKAIAGALGPRLPNPTIPIAAGTGALYPRLARGPGL